METMHAAGRRRLPPVPRPGGDRSAAGVLTVDEPSPVDSPELVVESTETTTPSATAASADDPASDTEVIDTRVISADLIEAELARLVEQADPEAAPVEAVGDETTDTDDTTDAADTDDTPDPADPADAAEQDPAQEFVSRLRTAATDFAGAAGATSAIVREAVPPARHRRARCRLVLRHADGGEVDVTMLGPAGAPGRPSRHGFDRQILRWLGAGLPTDDAWMMADPDAPGGIAVDLTAWVATA